MEKQENDISKLKDAVQMNQERCEKQDELLQKILSTVENLTTSSPSLFQSKSVRSMRIRLKKAQLDSRSSSNSVFSNDDSTFPLLPQ